MTGRSAETKAGTAAEEAAVPALSMQTGYSAFRARDSKISLPTTEPPSTSPRDFSP